MDDKAAQNTPNTKEQTPKQRVVEALKNANNVLVTVSTNPSVDQLAACIGLTLMMNKLDKHATAVFSGAVPSTLEFLEPGKTLEANTDSLRDFIISLDKAKADKLRYKVEDDVVKIFITPYRTSIGAADLEFTQGQFNVDVVVALGVENRDQLDDAIIQQGQILHDAVVVDMSCGDHRPVEMGSINWHEATASSLCEMLVSISESFKTGLLDQQMSTAFLTGIVAETDRFSNDRTTPKVMTMSAQLMAAGANQQLIANQLAYVPEPVAPEPVYDAEPAAKPGELIIQRDQEPELTPIPEETLAEDEQPAINDAPPQAATEQDDEDTGVLSLRHEDHTTVDVDAVADTLGIVDETPTDETVDPENEAAKIEIDEHGKMVDLAVQEAEKEYSHHQRVIKPLSAPDEPVSKTALTDYKFDAPTPGVVAPTPGAADVAANPMTVQGVPFGEQPAVVPELQPEPQPEVINTEPTAEQTLADLERAVDSPHVAQDAARYSGAEHRAMAEAGYVPEPKAPENETDQPAPPPLPPPMMPMFMPPRQSGDGELNLPSPQQNV